MISEQAVMSRNLEETEIPGLVGWSLPWVNALVVITLLTTAQSFYIAYQQYIGAKNPEVLPWALARGSAFLSCAFLLNQFGRAGKSFVQSQTERKLSRLLLWLSVFWVGLAGAMLATLAFHFVEVGGGFFSAVSTREPFFLVLCSITIPLVCASVGWAETKATYVTGSFLKCINPFAIKMLPKLRFVSVLAIAGGFLCLLLGAMDYLYDVSNFWFGLPLVGLAMGLMGGFIQWYRRAVRDICRNATPNYFERTLNRLNLFWLATSVLASIIFLGGFF
jgi:hypothetical protein